MNIEQIVLDRIIEALRHAEAKHPGFPVDVVHGACILVEEAGSVAKAALDYYYGRSDNKEKLAYEIAHAGAMSIRFLLSLVDPKHYPDLEKK